MPFKQKDYSSSICYIDVAILGYGWYMLKYVYIYIELRIFQNTHILPDFEEKLGKLTNRGCHRSVAGPSQHTYNGISGTLRCSSACGQLRNFLTCLIILQPQSRNLFAGNPIQAVVVAAIRPFWTVLTTAIYSPMQTKNGINFVLILKPCTKISSKASCIRNWVKNAGFFSMILLYYLSK